MDARRKAIDEPVMVCPECGIDLAGLDTTAHAELHWPKDTPVQYMGAEARKRREQTVAGGVERTEQP